MVVVLEEEEGVEEEGEEEEEDETKKKKPVGKRGKPGWSVCCGQERLLTLCVSTSRARACLGRRAPVLNLELIDLHVTTGTVRTDRTKFSAFMWILLYLQLNALKYMYYM